MPDTTTTTTTTSDYPMLITNAEVGEILRQRLASSFAAFSHHRRYRHRDWIAQAVVDYLSSAPQMDDPSRRDELQLILQAKKKTKSSDGSSSVTAGFGLTEAESVQVVNLLPTEPVEIHLMIEDLHARMPDRQQDQLLQLVAGYRQSPAAAAVCLEVNGDGHGGGDSVKNGDARIKTEDV